MVQEVEDQDGLRMERRRHMPRSSILEEIPKALMLEPDDSHPYLANRYETSNVTTPVTQGLFQIGWVPMAPSM